MKKNFYNTFVLLSNANGLHYNAFNNNFLLLDALKHKEFVENGPDEIKCMDPELYELLENNGFIIEDDIDELSIVEFRKISTKLDSTLYNIVINTTLDCNLDCWYCYEHKQENSILKDDIVELIENNIKMKYSEIRFKRLMVSFFGGEPLLNIEAVKKILIFCRNFSDLNDIELIADFTTNLTLLSDDLIYFLSNYKCRFQVTFDGDEKKHNKVRFYKKDKTGTYKTILDNIYKIQTGVCNSKVWIRINFDNQTLINFKDILKDISGLDRKRNFLIIRKVWQLKPNSIEKNYILSALDSAIKLGFHIDNYSLPRTSLCFAERLNEVLINYDGRVFKCSTYDCFDDTNAEGVIDRNTGIVHWNTSKLAKKMIRKTPERCIQCKLFPVCLGPCSRKCQSNTDEFVCMIDSTGLSMEEFIVYNFKLAMLRKRLGY